MNGSTENTEEGAEENAESNAVDTVVGASRVAVNGEVLGNNQYIAQIIQREVG